MPSKNVTKIYLQNSYYHIYNRGVEKRLLFEDQQDYSVFLSYLKEYLLPKDKDILMQLLADPKTPRNEKQKVLKLLRLNNFHNRITLVAYCLMPNHFHLLIRQKDELAIDHFMNSLCTRYTMYFNRKYKRVGRLYQDVYKAVIIENESYLLHLSRYIHKQAIVQGDPLNSLNQPSSLQDYLGIKKTAWVKPDEILGYFSKSNPAKDYYSFILQDEVIELLSNLILED